MKYNKKAQASIEFLTIYGWVLIILLGVIGVLLNYGFLNPSKYLPEKVDFGEQLKCEEFFLDADSDTTTAGKQPVIILNFRNNFLRSINVTNLYIRKNDETVSCNIKSNILSVGDTTIFGCNETELSTVTKNKIRMTIEFRRNATGTNLHNISGIVFAEATNNEYCDTLISLGDPLHCHDNIKDCGETNIDMGGGC